MHRNKGRRPVFVPEAKDREAVKLMAGHNIGQERIAPALGIAEKTPRRHFRHEHRTGHVKANTRVAGNLYRIATGSGREAVTAAIF